jgi:hypothetical protein
MMRIGFAVGQSEAATAGEQSASVNAAAMGPMRRNEFPARDLQNTRLGAAGAQSDEESDGITSRGLARMTPAAAFRACFRIAKPTLNTPEQGAT